MMLLNQINTKLLISLLLIVALQFSFSQEKIKIDGISSVIGDFIILDSDIDKVLIDMESQGLSTRGISRCQLLGKLMEDKLYAHHAIQDSLEFSDNEIYDYVDRQIEYFTEQLGDIDKVLEFYNKRDEYFKKTNDGKQILRQAMSEYIPLNIINAPKQGFSSPDASWFKGPSIDFVREKLNDDNSEIYNYLNKDILRTLINQHLEGYSNKRLLIWSFLYVNEWIRQNLFLKSHKVN